MRCVLCTRHIHVKPYGKLLRNIKWLRIYCDVNVACDIRSHLQNFRNAISVIMNYYRTVIGYFRCWHTTTYTSRLPTTNSKCAALNTRDVLLNVKSGTAITHMHRHRCRIHNWMPWMIVHKYNDAHVCALCVLCCVMCAKLDWHSTRRRPEKTPFRCVLAIATEWSIYPSTKLVSLEMMLVVVGCSDMKITCDIFPAKCLNIIF